ncbi:probable xyloglucan galactosyltransferase GT14 at C-terminar half [Coccomyxa sp. Obi]|nr:probable xyloglucan galactosyltransferase GT14 at C-terminar half [Coccomyxa sp. Obi]
MIGLGRRTWLRAAVAAWLVIGIESQADLPICEGRKIYVLDVGVFADQQSMPACNPDTTFRVDPITNVPFLHDDPQVRNAYLPQYLGQYSGPWHLAQAIRGSQYVTTDLDAADIVYVYDYCYYTWWLSFVHSNGRVQRDDPTPGDHLLKSYQALIQTPRWQRHDGADFVFYDPHPGFGTGRAEMPVIDMMCNTFRNAMHIVAERSQRNVCQHYWTMSQKLLIVPYVPATSDIARPLKGFQMKVTPANERHIMLWFRTKCLPYIMEGQGRYVNGHRFCHHVAIALGKAGVDVDVSCTDRQLGGRPLPFRSIMERMRNATFCLSMPGDSASTRRLSETIMAGCIPVFVGPPYASMPMADHVNYREFSVFINISDYSGWLQDKMEWEIHPTIRPYHVLNPWTWIPDVQVEDIAIKTENVSSIAGHLRYMDKKEILHKLDTLAVERQKFSFQPFITGPFSAINIILSSICNMTLPPKV